MGLLQSGRAGLLQPTDNAFIESFNSRLRQECLNASWFLCLPDERQKPEAWRRDYNSPRPQSALGNLTASEFVSEDQANSGPESGTVA